MGEPGEWWVLRPCSTRVKAGDAVVGGGVRIDVILLKDTKETNKK